VITRLSSNGVFSLFKCDFSGFEIMTKNTKCILYVILVGSDHWSLSVCI